MAECLYNPASEYYADFILRYFYRNPEITYETARTRCVNFINQEYAVIHAALSNIRDLNVADYSYAAIPKLYGLLDTPSLDASGIPQALDQPILRANGRGILIGLIDTGIDYTNPFFQNPDGTSRILRLWDQSLGNDSARSDFPSFSEEPQSASEFRPLYGAVFRQSQINEALSLEDPYSLIPSQDEIGHGTFMAGAAAASRTSQPVTFSGAAPEAALAVVKLKPAKQYLRDFYLIPDGVPAYQENDIMAAVSFLTATASELQMPLVIYLGVGTSQGSHDGTSPLGQQLQSFSGYPGIAVVTGAGNETGYQHHYYGVIAKDQPFDEVEIRVGPSRAASTVSVSTQNTPTGFCLELWAREPDLFSIGLVSPSGEVVERIPQSLGTNLSFPFRLDGSRVTISSVNYEAGSGSQLIFFRFQNPSAGIWRIRVYPTVRATGEFHLWLPLQQFLTREVIFLRPDPDTTITDPGNSSMPITVGAWDPVTSGIYIHSSRGFTRSGQIKPELAAPGVNVQGPSASSERLTRMSGTSVAAAVTAGAVADLFTWAFTDRNDLTMSGAAAQSMLIRGAGRSSAYSYPNREWGFGTLDLYKAFLS